MACERCGATRVQDSSLISATVKAPNGEKLFLKVVIAGSHDAHGQSNVFFCSECWLFFLRMCAPDLRVPLIIDGQTPTA